MNAHEVTFLGWTDEETTCDLCGRVELKSTAAIEVDGAVCYFGCVCAAKVLNRTAKEIKSESTKAQRDQEACAKAFDQGLALGWHGRVEDACRAFSCELTRHVKGSLAPHGFNGAISRVFVGSRRVSEKFSTLSEAIAFSRSLTLIPS